MPTLPLHLTPSATGDVPPNPLPQLLHTPLGIALLELQGTFNLPLVLDNSDATDIGKLVFPSDFGADGNKKVWMYVGANQRMTGELKKLSPPVGVLRRRVGGDAEMRDGGENREEKWEGEELEVAEVVYWKLVFSARPEPVGSGM
jgi:chromosome transmission fidelity protein 8